MIKAPILHVNVNVQSLGLNINFLELKLVREKKKKEIQNVIWLLSSVARAAAYVRSTHTAWYLHPTSTCSYVSYKDPSGRVLGAPTVKDPGLCASSQKIAS